MNVYDVTVKRKDGSEQSMADFKGKVLLIVNTATGCGFTPQYEGLQNLYKKYADKGLEILDFPCNQFGNQAPGTAEQIFTFCTSKYGTTFPQFAKIEVNGDKASELFKFLKTKKKPLLGSSIKWNFTKFLVDRDGTVIARFAPTVTPEQLEKHLVKLL
ncbi:MAG: glutathione peroxidase [Spirochaetaceae bacterium]|jgi:glutathione peroxidase|nr:glutathione peroxidase [Spirochaetaceae bacterium]